MDIQTENLLKAISNYKTLSAQQQQNAGSILRETIETYKDLRSDHTVIDNCVRKTNLYQKK